MWEYELQSSFLLNDPYDELLDTCLKEYTTSEI